MREVVLPLSLTDVYQRNLTRSYSRRFNFLGPRNLNPFLFLSHANDPQVILDVQQFSPDEITVKTVDKNVVVEAKHEERQDEHGYVSRHFVRRYVLPTDYDATNVTSTLSSDGVLTIMAPRKV